MTETVLENLSGSKLAVLVTFLMVGQIMCFLLGALIAPQPANAQTILGTVCEYTSTTENDTMKWFYNRGKGKCLTVTNNYEELAQTDKVIVFQMPVPPIKNLDRRTYSRWQQNLIAVLQFDVQNDFPMKNLSFISLDIRLAYKNTGDPDHEWKLYARSIEKRLLDCKPGKDCTVVPLFELGSLCYDNYLLNIRVLPKTSENYAELDHLEHVWLTVINQNEGFTKVWVSLKSAFCVIVIGTLCWFCMRVKKLERNALLLEKMLVSLGITLCSVNLPMEFLTLYFDMPLVLLLGDIRQLVFYIKIFIFWLVLFGERMLINNTFPQSTIKQYALHLCAVVLACIFVFIFDICERGVQLKNPFYSIWMTGLGENLTLAYMILSRMFIGIYFLFLCYKSWQVLIKVDLKRTHLPTISFVRRLHYEGIIYRYKFFLLTTLVCAAMTLIVIILGQTAERKLDMNFEVENTSAFFVGVYGMWNIYIIAVLILYAPSHKKWEVAENTNSCLRAPIYL